MPLPSRKYKINQLNMEDPNLNTKRRCIYLFWMEALGPFIIFRDYSHQAIRYQVAGVIVRPLNGQRPEGALA